MKIVALSDTHMVYDFADAPSGDLLIIAGDILNRGTVKELQDTMLQLSKESHRWKHILIVPGNHDFALEGYMNSKLTWEDFAEDRYIFHYPRNMTISWEGMVEILGLKIFTWSWVPNLPNWAFYMFDDRILPYFKLRKFDIPKKVDLVVSHGPPYGVLDFVPRYGPVGSKTMEGVFEFEYDKHIFGHVHEGAGTTIQDANENIVHTGGAEFRRYYNVSVLNGRYEFENEPITFEI